MLAHGTQSCPLKQSRKLNGKHKKLKKGEYTVIQWTKKKSEPKELDTNRQADFIKDDIKFSVIESSDN